MSESTWRPFGVEAEDEIAEYDALHDGVPAWMESAFWAWVRLELLSRGRTSGGSYSSGNYVDMLNCPLAERMCQILRIPLPHLRADQPGYSVGQRQLETAIEVLQRHSEPLAIADYLLGFGDNPDGAVLQGLLDRAKSAWTIGERAGHSALTRRVPLGVQDAADSVMGRAGRAGARLAKAWEALYGLEPDASVAYGLAIKAIEDAAIPVVIPTDGGATLGKVISVMEQQGNWKLPLDREHDRAPSGATLIEMMRLVWVGQHDRHGGQPSAPGDVSIEEATVALSLAVTLVNLFAARLPARTSTS